MALKSWLTLDGRRTSNSRFTYSNIANLLIRFLQILMACVVIGYYARDLNAARKVNKYSDSKWVFAVVVATLAAVTALIFAVVGFFSQYRTVALFFGWEWILVILWAAVTGVFGGMYANENPEMDGGIDRMKTAFHFDIVNLLLWAITAIAGTITFIRQPKRSLHTGRATT